VWRPAVALAVVAGLAAGCGGGGGAPSPATQLKIHVETGTADAGLVASDATLRCDDRSSGTGFLRGAAAAACTAVARHVLEAVAAAQRKDRICSQIYGGPQAARITGTANGVPVSLTVTRTDGCGVADWETLRALLGDPERRDSASPS